MLALPASGIVGRADVVDLSSKLSAYGKLDWAVPPGDWIIYRLGRTTMGTLLQPAQWEAIGLECDKIAGCNLIEAEAYTGGPGDSRWAETPAWLKPIGDAAFCDSVNACCCTASPTNRSTSAGSRAGHGPVGHAFRPHANMAGKGQGVGALRSRAVRPCCNGAKSPQTILRQRKVASACA
ncbi:MAG: glycosyl hydrolase [Verrucomicrobiota bacterium]